MLLQKRILGIAVLLIAFGASGRAAYFTDESLQRRADVVIGPQASHTYVHNVNGGKLATNIDALFTALPAAHTSWQDMLYLLLNYDGLTRDEGLALISNMSGDDKTKSLYAVRSLVLRGRGAVDGRINELMAARGSLYESEALDGAYAAAALNCAPANRVWAGALGVWEKFDGKNGYTGYDYDAYGAVVGYDRAFGDFDFGASFMYAKADLDEQGAVDDNDIDNYGFSLYGTYYHRSGFFASLKGGYIYSDNDMAKHFLRGVSMPGWQTYSNHTNTYWAEAKAGYNWRLNEKFTLTPSIGLMYIYSKASAFASRGAFLLANFGTMTGKSMPMPIDLAASYRTCVGAGSYLTFTVRGGYAYDFKNDPVTGSMTYIGIADGMPIVGYTPGKSIWTAGAGVQYEFRNFDVGLDYLYEGRSKTDTHKLMCQFGVKF